MPRKGKPERPDGDDLWVAPNHSFKGDRGQRGWDHLPVPLNDNRLLELADIALGVKKPERTKKRAANVHQTNKSEPYSPQE